MASVTRKPTAEHSGSEHGMRLRFSSLLAACFLVVAAVALAYVGRSHERARLYVAPQRLCLGIRAHGAPLKILQIHLLPRLGRILKKIGKYLLPRNCALPVPCAAGPASRLPANRRTA